MISLIVLCNLKYRIEQPIGGKYLRNFRFVFLDLFLSLLQNFVCEFGVFHFKYVLKYETQPSPLFGKVATPYRRGTDWVMLVDFIWCRFEFANIVLISGIGTRGIK